MLLIALAIASPALWLFAALSMPGVTERSFLTTLVGANETRVSFYAKWSLWRESGVPNAIRIYASNQSLGQTGMWVDPSTLECGLDDTGDRVPQRVPFSLERIVEFLPPLQELGESEASRAAALIERFVHRVIADGLSGMPASTQADTDIATGEFPDPAGEALLPIVGPGERIVTDPTALNAWWFGGSAVTIIACVLQVRRLGRRTSSGE